MKRYSILALAGFVFGIISGCVGMAIAYGETLPDPTQEHWYDLAAVFSVPGVGLTWAIFNPPDGYYGDIWDNRTHIVLLNGLSWIVIVFVFLFLKRMGKFFYHELKMLRIFPK